MSAKERPILFRAPMVRAILAGTKTQTRRAVKRQPPANTYTVGLFHHPDPRPHFWAWTDSPTRPDVANLSDWCAPCPYGQPGDRLWVRESHLIVGGLDSKSPRVVYAATNDGPDAWLSPVWRPSIHMHRWASRITLEITGVRVERLQAISEADAKAEGLIYNGAHRPPWSSDGLRHWPTARDAFADLWRDINGEDSWDANPWVWVVEFKRVA